MEGQTDGYLDVAELDRFKAGELVPELKAPVCLDDVTSQNGVGLVLENIDCMSLKLIGTPNYNYMQPSTANASNRRTIFCSWRCPLTLYRRHSRATLSLARNWNLFPISHETRKAESDELFSVVSFELTSPRHVLGDHT